MSFRKIIFLSDDSETFIMFMSILLTRMGFRIIPSKIGPEAVKLSKVILPDLIILDINLSRKEGKALLRGFKSDKELAALPVIIVTGDPVEEVAEQYKDFAPFAGFLRKPVRIDDLHSLLQENIYASLGWKRKHLRANLNLKAEVRHNGSIHELMTETVSVGGAYLRKVDPFPVGTELKITLPVGEKALTLKGRVIYTKNLYGEVFNTPPGMAVEFQNISPSDAARLFEFITSTLSHDIFGQVIEDPNVAAVKTGPETPKTKKTARKLTDTSKLKLGQMVHLIRGDSEPEPYIVTLVLPTYPPSPPVGSHVVTGVSRILTPASQNESFYIFE